MYLDDSKLYGQAVFTRLYENYKTRIYFRSEDDNYANINLNIVIIL